MRVYRKGIVPPETQPGGTLGRMEIDLSDDDGGNVLDEAVRAQLVAIGERLAEEAMGWSTAGTDKAKYGERVLGVNFQGITFNLILGPKR